MDKEYQVTEKPILNEKLQDILLAARSLILFRDLLDDPVVKGFLHLLTGIREAGSPAEITDAYYSFINLLATRGAPGSWPDAWQRHLVHLILEQENVLSRWAEAEDPEKLPNDLCHLASHDLKCLEKMFAVSPHEVKEAVKSGRHVDERSGIPGWEHLVLNPSPEPDAAQEFYHSNNWSELVLPLTRHYRHCGSGKFARFIAFRWHQGQLQEIPDPDPITMDMLVGLEEQQRIILENTEHFLQGLPASNILLYGKRGTGKSSLVKAVLNRYQSQGLRLVEVSKESMSELPQVLRLLRGRVFRFIVFIDDLSFEEYEVEYKFLKAILEGGVETLPDNVLVYATSNRRHLVSEYFSDRQGTEIHQDDSLQEKLSIADRFGISILFPSPNQELYLKIVEGLARQRGLNIEGQELKNLALKWEKSHNGPSGRTARQFVDYLTARLARKSSP